MKHGKKPTVAQRRFLEAKGIIWSNWLVVKDTPDIMELCHRNFNQTRIVRKVDSYV